MHLRLYFPAWQASVRMFEEVSTVVAWDVSLWEVLSGKICHTIPTGSVALMIPEIRMRLTARLRPFSRDKMELARHDSDILRVPPARRVESARGVDGSSPSDTDRGTEPSAPAPPRRLPPILPPPRSNLTPATHHKTPFLFCAW